MHGREERKRERERERERGGGEGRREVERGGTGEGGGEGEGEGRGRGEERGRGEGRGGGEGEERCNNRHMPETHCSYTCTCAVYWHIVYPVCVLQEHRVLTSCWHSTALHHCTELLVPQS